MLRAIEDNIDAIAMVIVIACALLGFLLQG